MVNADRIVGYAAICNGECSSSGENAFISKPFCENIGNVRLIFIYKYRSIGSSPTVT